MLPPGEQLKKLRNRLGITTREVEEYSRTIAAGRQNHPAKDSALADWCPSRHQRRRCVLLLCLGNWSFPIVDCQLPIYPTEFRILLQSEIGKQKSAMRKPRAITTRGLSSNLIRTAVERLAELFSGFFYVAASRLNSPRWLLLKHRPPQLSRSHGLSKYRSWATIFYLPFRV